MGDNRGVTVMVQSNDSLRFKLANYNCLVMFNLTGLNYFRHYPSGLPYFFFMIVFIQSFHISTCKNYAY